MKTSLLIFHYGRANLVITFICNSNTKKNYPEVGDLLVTKVIRVILYISVSQPMVHVKKIFLYKKIEIYHYLH